MNSEQDSLYALVELMRLKAPEYFALLSAKSESEFDEAFDTIIERAISILETNSKNFVSLNEVGLTGALAMALTMPGLTVTQETNSNGHVDLTVSADHCMPARKKLGEAKIHNGPAYHVAGLKQLLQRYTTGRESRGLVISYVRKKNIAGLVKEIRAHMDKDHPCDQKGETVDHKIKWSFVSTHTHSCGEDLQVSHIGCNLFVENTTATAE
jgi:hypothetical protein